MARIGFTGAHGCGKTSVVNELKTYMAFEKHIAIPSTARAASAAGYGINKQADRLSQYLLMMARIVAEENAGGRVYF